MLCRYLPSVLSLRLLVLTILGPIAVFIGRKTSLYVAVLLCYVANIVMMMTTTIGGLYAGRLVNGLANGFLMTFSQLYIQVWETAYYFRL